MTDPSTGEPTSDPSDEDAASCPMKRKRCQGLQDRQSHSGKCTSFKPMVKAGITITSGNFNFLYHRAVISIFYYCFHLIRNGIGP